MDYWIGGLVDWWIGGLVGQPSPRPSPIGWERETVHNPCDKGGDTPTRGASEGGHGGDEGGVGGGLMDSWTGGFVGLPSPRPSPIGWEGVTVCNPGDEGGDKGCDEGGVVGAGPSPGDLRRSGS
jgi:hypothetical protein